MTARRLRCTAGLLALSGYGLAQTSHPALQTLYTFSGGADGYMPLAGVIVTEGVLYGTTQYGGVSNYGVVYALAQPPAPNAPWTETTLYSFTGGADGGEPAGTLTLSGGIFYGSSGGGFGILNTTGAIFSLTPPASPGAPWTEANLYSFPNRSNGSNPQGAPWFVTGPQGQSTLYGTTSSGGACPGSLWGCGTLFALTPPDATGVAWNEAVLHRFERYVAGRSFPDGAYPNGNLAIGQHAVLFGAASGGGSNGHGMVFSFTPPGAAGDAWLETDVHDFGAFPGDGSGPAGGVTIGPAGVLYGTTQFGGASGYGTVFSLTPPASPGATWIETVLYSFGGGSDGKAPSAGVTFGPGGVLYGTTAQGGINTPSCQQGCGTVFSLAPPTTSGRAWTNTTLFRFAGGSHPWGPAGNLWVTPDGLLIGATQFGGSCLASSAGCGTVFALQP